MNETLLKIENLGISFNGAESPVVQDVSFELKRGEAIGVIGPNGSGKTSVLHAILNIIPYKGEIKFYESIDKNDEIGYLPQKLEINRSIALSVKDFLKLNLNGRSKLADSNEKIKKMLEFLHSENLLDRQLIYLSRGEIQRILFIASLLNEPKILLLDEPTTGADPTAEETIYSHIAELKEKGEVGIIFVSHDLNIVSKLANKVLCLNKKMLCFGEPREAFSESNLIKLYGENVKLYEHEHKNIY